jgi:hypothetical protein
MAISVQRDFEAERLRIKNLRVSIPLLPASCSLQSFTTISANCGLLRRSNP